MQRKRTILYKGKLDPGRVTKDGKANIKTDAKKIMATVKHQYTRLHMKDEILVVIS